MAVSNKSLIEAYKKKNAAIDQSVAAQGNAYDAQISDVRDSAADQLQSLYLQNERQKRLQAQAQKAAGITGGASESAAVALAANYNTNRTNALLERDRQISQLGIQKEQARAEGELQKSANIIEMEQGKLSFETDQRDFAWQKENADRQFKADQANSDRTYHANQAAQLKNEAWEMVRAGVINAEIAKQIGRPISVLKEYYRKYKENKS
ncbi:MAG: hypothetical protein IJN80_05175 [Clostridia bacterium]|nr:hypothetical protein [Clostridia bacterium]